jgi:hypothetical protein
VPATPSGGADWDVRGNYALTYDDRLTLKLNIGGAVREVTATGYGGIVDFGTHEGHPLRLDLREFCGRADVLCPSETFWTQVAINQDDVNRRQDLYVINVINDTVRNLPAGQRAEVRGGLVNHAQQDTFLLGLGATSGGSQNCGALALSLAGGRFRHVGERFETRTVYRDAQGRPCAPPDAGVSADAGVGADGGTAECRAIEERQRIIPPGAAAEGIEEGKVALGWLGACAFGPFIAAATLTLETGFTGRRVGEFDPPPFTPTPPMLPDAGTPDGGG